MGCIYKMTNKITKKVYIGKTTNTLETRIKWHKQSIYKSDNKLTRALIKYGFDNFDIIVLEDNIDNDKLNEAEIRYIAKYDSYHNGYNSTLGGDGASIYTDEDIKNVINLYDKYNNIRKVSRETGINVETIRNMLKSNNKYKDKHSEKIGVVMYSVDFVPEMYFESISDVCKFLCADRGNIYNRIKKHYDGSLFMGHRWQLASEIILESENKIFRSKFDKDAYLNGENAYKPEGKKYYVVDSALNFLNIKNNKVYKCKYCGTAVKTDRQLCLKCEQKRRLIKNGKTLIPTKEQLMEDIKTLNYSQIAEKYGRSNGTVYTWRKKYNLI